MLRRRAHVANGLVITVRSRREQEALPQGEDSKNPVDIPAIDYMWSGTGRFFVMHIAAFSDVWEPGSKTVLV
jgi:hypothetical protein